ncbi:hypothetical protein ACQ4M3_25575 [Leptolyngbya sp. AN03gr2]|uniref:hypothetical protein n=1 Tax=unclassified Leptolyngbya TaxID=2650499 RepID=UPI003D31CED1
MYTPEQILKTAQILRSQVAQTLPPEQIAQLDTLILQAQAGENVSDEILLLLGSNELLREPAQALLADSSDFTEEVKGYVRLTGAGSPISYPRYQCPDCGYTWSRIDFNEPIPSCAKDPTHRLLQPIDNREMQS